MEIHLLSSFMRSQDASNLIACFHVISSILVNKSMTSLKLFSGNAPSPSLSKQFIHFFLRGPTLHTQDLVSPSQAHGTVSYPAYTPLDSCTPTLGSMHVFVLLCEGDSMWWHHMKYGHLSSQHHQQLGGAVSAMCHRGKGTVWLGRVCSHKV